MGGVFTTLRLELLSKSYRDQLIILYMNSSNISFYSYLILEASDYDCKCAPKTVIMLLKCTKDRHHDCNALKTIYCHALLIIFFTKCFEKINTI